MHAEEETRAVQTALDAEAERRRAQEARVASLEETDPLLLAIAGMETKRGNLVSVILEGDVEGLRLAQQTEQHGMLLQERVGAPGRPCRHPSRAPAAAAAAADSLVASYLVVYVLHVLVVCIYSYTSVHQV